ncbi:MAG: TIGR03668 family PPOX class F420-dependent oxidoreductase [Actinomycetota bacterium]
MLVAEARVARLATAGERGPHVVPITFAVLEERIVTAIDHKPKTTRSLKRLANIARDPGVSMLVDHYSDDWESLWWCRLDGRATVHGDGPAFGDAIDALAAKYPQYGTHPPEGPVIVIDVERRTGWTAVERH